jgi:hypothetical protein
LMSGPDGSQRAGSFDSTLSPNYSLRRNGLLSPREVRHERQKLLPPCSVALRHYCRAAIHPCRWRVAGSGQRDNLSSSVGKLDCLRGYRWTCVDRFRRITPGLSGERTDRLAQMRQDDWKACSMGGDPWAMFRGSPAHHLISICPESLTLHLQFCKRGRISFR